MQFRLTYSGRLLATRNDKGARKRSLHKHEVRKQFQKQLRRLWQEHPVLKRGHSSAPVIGSTMMTEVVERDGFLWKPLVTEKSGLICGLDILMLRAGEPRDALYDIRQPFKDDI